MKNKVTASVVAALFITATAGAQTSAQGENVWTLDRAISTALKENNQLAQQRFEVEKADQQVKEAWGSALPKIDVTGQYQNALKSPVFFLPDFSDPNSGRTVPIKIGSKHAITGSITAQQILFNSAVFVGIGASDIYSKAARKMYRAKASETVAGVRKAFYQALLAREMKTMMEQLLANSEENYKNAELMWKQGILSEYDKLRASVALENLRPQVMQAQTGYQLALDNLRATIGRVPAEGFVIEGDLTFKPVDEAELDNAEDNILNANWGYQALGLQVQVANAFVTAEKSAYLPTIAAFGNYQYQTQKNDLRISTADFIQSSTVGLSFSFNVFEGLRTNARVTQRELEVRKAEESLDEMEKRLKTAAHMTVANIRQAAKRVEVQQQTIDNAKRGYEIASARFKSGAATQLELNDAQFALTQAHVNRMQALYDYLTALADLENLLGMVPQQVEQYVEID